MAKFDLSQKGADDLKQLAKDLAAINREIEESGKKLQSSTLTIQKDLGPYGDEILEMVKKVNTAQKKGREAMDQLQNKLAQMAAAIETLMDKKIGGR